MLEEIFVLQLITVKMNLHGVLPQENKNSVLENRHFGRCNDMEPSFGKGASHEDSEEMHINGICFIPNLGPGKYPGTPELKSWTKF